VLVISLVLGAAAGLAAVWIGRTIAVPIEALSQFAERVSLGERTQVPRSGSAREVTRLVRSIDSMRRQLEGRPFVETFATDLSHELKNPVAAIRASAEVLEESALEEPAEARRFVARIREAAGRIERLLSELLSLARIEARGLSTFGAVDLTELAVRSAESLGHADRIDIEAAGDARVVGDTTWLGRAITNLLDNALVHGASDAPVKISVHDLGSRVRVAVESSGQVAEHVKGQLFRRFVSTRIDKGGSGLGLAIVRAVAEAHGGQVRLAEGGPPAVVFVLELPSARHARPSLEDEYEADRETPGATTDAG
jgi:signal transduction histidine kinase